MKPYSRLCARIDLDAVERNFASMRANIHPDTKMIAVIKADGYGHGASPIARLVQHYSYLWGFAVATAEEAFSLRMAGIQKPILILGYVFEEHYANLIEHGVRLTVFDTGTARKLSREAARQKRTAHIHIALDTGMTRIGFFDGGAGVRSVCEIASLPNLSIEGLFTHFARADEADKRFSMEQLSRYQAFSDALLSAGVKIPIRHCSNSAGIIDLPQANLDAVRAGISIYGIYPSQEVRKERVTLSPVMELKSHISYVKEVDAGVPVSYGGTFVTERKTRVATIPAGYADGYPRQLSNRGRVLIRQKSAPILGRICMDQFMVDVTDIPEAEALDEVTLLGADGAQRITVEELGALSGRFPYEFVCDIGKRVPRVYMRDGRVSEQKDFFGVY